MQLKQNNYMEQEPAKDEESAEVTPEDIKLEDKTETPVEDKDKEDDDEKEVKVPEDGGKDDDELFERDDDWGEENADLDDDDKGEAFEEGHDQKVKLKVNINVTNYKSSEMEVKEKKTKVDQQKEFVQDFRMLDLLFSFIGAGSQTDIEQANQTSLTELNMQTNYSQMPSR